MKHAAKWVYRILILALLAYSAYSLSRIADAVEGVEYNGIDHSNKF